MCILPHMNNEALFSLALGLQSPGGLSLQSEPVAAVHCTCKPVLPAVQNFRMRPGSEPCGVYDTIPRKWQHLNSSLCVRLGIDPKNAAQATVVINKTLETGLIRWLRAG